MKKLFIVRHAERPDILPNDVGNDVLLTDNGKIQSRLFGKQLPQPTISIKTSPIERCLQTANLIAEETKFDLSAIEATTVLGDPGFIIEDADLAWQHWLKKGHQAVNQHLLSGSQKWSGFVDLDHAVKSICKHIKSLLISSEAGTHIWVTHDTILATLASRLLEDSIALSEWPSFLGYLEISLDGDNELLVNYSQNFQ